MNGGQAEGRKGAEVVAEELREAAERLAMGYAVAGVRNRHQKCILDMSPEAERLLGGEFRFHIVALDEEGRLVRCSVTTVSHKATGATILPPGCTSLPPSYKKGFPPDSLTRH